MVSKETKQAFEEATKLRAKAYAYFFEELIKEMDVQAAKDLCSRATYRLGLDKAETIPEKSRDSAQKIAEHFVANSVGNAVFNQRILSADKNKAVIEMKNCPLVIMWRDMKLPNTRICTLCDFAHKIDYGNIEGAGFKLSFTSRIACGDESCILEISKK